MPRLVLLLIAALALLLGAASAQAAPAAQTHPTARVADDLDDAAEDDGWTDDDACAPDEDDDACLDDAWEDDDVWCEDDSALDGEDEEVLDEETYAEEGEPIAAAADDECGEDAAPAAPEVTALSATVAGEDDRLRVHVAFRLDQAGPVELTLARTGAVTSRRARGACPSGARAAAAKRKRKAKGKKCGARLPGSMTVVGRPGANTVQLRGRWRGKRLASGTYLLTATPKAPGATSDTATFKIAAG